MVYMHAVFAAFRIYVKHEDAVKMSGWRLCIK